MTLLPNMWPFLQFSSQVVLHFFNQRFDFAALCSLFNPVWPWYEVKLDTDLLILLVGRCRSSAVKFLMKLHERTSWHDRAQSERAFDIVSEQLDMRRALLLICDWSISVNAILNSSSSSSWGLRKPLIFSRILSNRWNCWKIKSFSVRQFWISRQKRCKSSWCSELQISEFTYIQSYRLPVHMHLNSPP